MRNENPKTIARYYQKLRKLNKKLLKKQEKLEQDEGFVQAEFIADEIRSLKKEIAWTLLDCGENEKALAMYKEMSWKTQGEIKYLGIGSALTEMGQLSEAKKLLQKGLKRFPGSVSIIVAIGNVYHDMGDYSQSLNHFNWALSMDPDDELILFSKANALYGLDLYEEAFPIYESLAKEYPDNPLFITSLGYCYLNINYPEDAAKCFKSVISNGCENDNIYNGLACAYLDMGLKADAIDTWNKGISKFPDPVLYRNLGITYFNSDWLLEAEDIVKEGLNRFPEDEELKELLESIEEEIINPDDDKKPPIPLIMGLLAMSEIIKQLKDKKLQRNKF